MHSHFFQSYFMNNSNFSSTFISFLSPCHNLFLLSRSVRCWTIVSADQLTCLCRFIVTYIAPLAFVLSVAMGKETYDDYKRHLRDREANSQRYLVLTRLSNANFDPEQAYPDAHANTRSEPSSSLRVGDLVLLEKDQRVPTDMILLHTSDSSGSPYPAN